MLTNAAGQLVGGGEETGTTSVLWLLATLFSYTSPNSRITRCLFFNMDQEHFVVIMRELEFESHLFYFTAVGTEGP